MRKIPKKSGIAIFNVEIIRFFMPEGLPGSILYYNAEDIKLLGNYFILLVSVSGNNKTGLNFFASSNSIIA